MLKEHLEWLCDFMNVEYHEENTFELWLSMKSLESKEYDLYYSIETKHKQLSIFDYDVA